MFLHLCARKMQQSGCVYTVTDTYRLSVLQTHLLPCLSQRRFRRHLMQLIAAMYNPLFFQNTPKICRFLFFIFFFIFSILSVFHFRFLVQIPCNRFTCFLALFCFLRRSGWSVGIFVIIHFGFFSAISQQFSPFLAISKYCRSQISAISPKTHDFSGDS